MIDKIFKIGTLEKIISEVDENLIQNVSTFDVYEGENIPKIKSQLRSMLRYKLTTKLFLRMI